MAVEEIWDRDINGAGVSLSPNNVPESVKDNATDDESSNIVFNLSAEAILTTSPVNLLSGSETTDGSSSFVKDGFDQSDLDSLEAEIARELED